MSILIDYSGVAFPAAFAACPMGNSIQIDLIRHAILNTIRKANVSFRNKFGKTIICCDASFSWRKQVFPHYKANRKKSDDMLEYFNCIRQIEQEVIENFPYQSIKIDGAEGDDVLAVLATHIDEKHVIIANDKDMVQLLKHPNVSVYSPSKEKYLTPTREYQQNKQKIVEELTPEKYLLTHILRGDRSDGIPSFQSDSDTFVTGKPHKMPDRVYVDNFNFNSLNETEIKRYNENKLIIDLSMIPADIHAKIVESYDPNYNKPNMRIFDYMINHGLEELLAKIQDF